MSIKRFKKWFLIKEKIDEQNINKLPLFSEGEVWWCGIGENVGIEINGKSEVFSRPIVIYKKLSRMGFMAIPMSTQFKNGSWYVSIYFQEKQVVLNISQARVVSSSRLYSRIGSLDENDIKILKEKFIELYK